MTAPSVTLAVTIVSLLLVSVLAISSDNVKFSKLLNERSEILRFTSISNAEGQRSPHFQNIYNRADHQISSPLYYDADFPQSKLITAPSSDEGFVRIRQELRSEPEAQVYSAPELDDTLTKINQKPISGRAQVTALRQSISGKRLNISPVFLSSNDQSTNQEEAEQKNNEDATQNPGNVEEEKDEVTTIQNFEVVKVSSENPTNLIETTTSVVPRIGVTIYDNRTNPDPLDSTTPISINLEEKENLVAESFHRHGPSFPDFEDVPTNLAGAESNQPARVNVRPASSGKNYEYEYIYYYYDDDDEGNATTPNPQNLTTPKVELSSQRVEPATFQSTKNIPVPSNFLQQPELLRDEKGPGIASAPEVLSLPNPAITVGLTPQLGSNRPIVLKQSNMPHVGGEPQEFPFVPRFHSNPPLQSTFPPETTTAPAAQIQNKLKTQPPAANQFDPPVLQFKFVETPAPILSSTPEPNPPLKETGRQRGRIPQRNQFEAQKESETELPSQDAPTLRRNPHVRRPSPLVVPREPELQQQGPPTVPEYTVPAQLVHEPLRLRPSPVPLQGQFQPPLIPSRGSDPILEVQSPSLGTTTTTAVSTPDRTARGDSFARQKSVNDLYALSRLHQLAINTKVPDKRGPESSERALQSNLPKISFGQVRSPEVVTTYPDPMEVGESTTLSSFAPAAFLTTADVQRIAYTTTEQIPIVSPSGDIVVTTATATNDRPTFKDRIPGSRFRGKLRTSTSSSPTLTTSTSTSTETPASKTYQHNRFAGRRRNFTAPTPSITHDELHSAPSVATPAAPAHDISTSRTPNRSRFGGRTRPTTSTEAPVTPPAEPVSIRTPNRRPVTGGVLNQRRRFSTSTVVPVPIDNIAQVSAEVPEEPQILAPAPTPLEADVSSRRPLARLRGRPNGVAPIVGRPLRGGRTSTTTTTTTTSTENPDAVLVTMDESETGGGDTVGTTILEGVDPAPTAPVQEAPAGVLTQKISVSSSSTTSESAAEQPKRGSAGVLGRLRNRSKPSVPSSTTLSPEIVSLSSTEKKPSRVSGILNRRKISSTTSSPIPNVPEPSPVVEAVEPAAPETIHPEAIPPNGVIVRVSSVVSETEAEHPENHAVEISPTPQQGSILNRLKSQRKPGSLFRRRPDH